MISQSGPATGRSAAVRPAVGQRVPAVAVPGREVPLAAATRCCTSRTRTGVDATTRRRMLDDLAKLNQMQARRDRRSGDQHAHRAVRDGVPDADVRAGADRPVEGAGQHVRAVRRRTRRSPARSPRTACWPGGWPSAACGSSSSSTAAGTSTATCRKQIAEQCQRHRPGLAPALMHDLKQRGLLDDTLVVWGGEFGRTVYCQGKLTRDRLRPRPPSALLHDWMAGGGIKPGITLRRDRRLLLQRRQGPGARPRPARHDPALPGHRPHPADVQVPGPRTTA